MEIFSPLFIEGQPFCRSVASMFRSLCHYEAPFKLLGLYSCLRLPGPCPFTLQSPPLRNGCQLSCSIFKFSVFWKCVERSFLLWDPLNCLSLFFFLYFYCFIFFLSFFFFFFFLGLNPRHMEVPRLGVHLATAADLHHSHGSAGSLTHGSRPGIKPATSWFLPSWIVSAAPQWELWLHFLYIKISLTWNLFWYMI